MEPLPILLLGCLAGLSLSLRRLAAGRRGRDVTGRTDAESGRPDPDDPDDAHDLSTLSRGDVVQREDEPGAGDELVSAALRLTDAGPWRTLCLLEGGAAPGLLLVAERGAEAERGDRAWLLHARPERRAELAVPTAAATESIEYDGLRHRLCGRFQALARAAELQPAEPRSGTRTAAAAPSGEPLLVVCYRGPGSRRLLLTRWHGEPAALLHVGEAVEPRQLLVLRKGPGPRSRRRPVR
jgi:hypothetical protein